MKKLFPFTLIVILAMSMIPFAGAVTATAAREVKILEFDTMIGVPRPYTGAANAIRGIPGGGLPWVVGSAAGELKANGQLEITIRGLVFDPSDPDVIARGIGGTNTVPNFKAIVSCMSKDASGNPTTVNVSTGLFPADAGGNANIDWALSLPSPCIAPIIFVTSPGGSWFASTGF